MKEAYGRDDVSIGVFAMEAMKMIFHPEMEKVFL